MCDKVVFEDPIMLKYCPDRYKTQKMCDIVVNASLPALKVVPDCLVTKIIVMMIFFSNDNIISLMKILIMGNFNVDPNYISLDIVYFNQDDPKTNILVRLMAWRNKFKQLEAFKKEMDKKSMPVA